MKRKKYSFIFLIFSFFSLNLSAKRIVPRNLGPGKIYRHGMLYNEAVDIQRLGPLLIYMHDYIYKPIFFSILEFYNAGFLDSRVRKASITGKLDLSNLGIKNLYGLSFVLDNVKRVVMELDLSNNAIERISKKNFARNLSRLEWLNLSNNKIKFLEQRCFGFLEALKFLDLGQNFISTVPLFPASLKILDLSDNQIKKIEKGPFIGIKTLNLMDNSIADKEAAEEELSQIKGLEFKL